MEAPRLALLATRLRVSGKAYPVASGVWLV